LFPELSNNRCSFAVNKVIQHNELTTASTNCVRYINQLNEPAIFIALLADLGTRSGVLKSTPAN
jgi:hypothetical protein